ncbi:winged helix-turn-helix transcriptional regulator [Aquimarina sp. 2201CG14-23]|uniref:winged helix-turn-helix transcriptional regulator n=1 Tax=Aquimarina mycalae TaxID=3040073 RepID=UPI002477F1FE|nr:helix-turn-helix domain-containing protein [Aquimarina sp. 2201CG14-23]MDH7447814.1 helix-turn-helix domain-containing protein [Aquimarina sp. 2201CG14-23]
MKKSEKKYSDCPVSHALGIIGGKWSLLVVKEIGLDKRRFGELKRLIPEISEKMLIQELKKLVGFGILNRKAYKEIPPKVEYSLTENGKSVLPIIDQIKTFGTEMMKKNNG